MKRKVRGKEPVPGEGNGEGVGRTSRPPSTDLKPRTATPKQPGTSADRGPARENEESRDDSPREIPDPDNDNYVWCEDVCERRPILPRDTSDTVYLVCENCGNVVRRQARKAKRMERIWARRGVPTGWVGNAFHIKQAQSVDQDEK